MSAVSSPRPNTLPPFAAKPRPITPSPIIVPHVRSSSGYAVATPKQAGPKPRYASIPTSDGETA